MAEFGLLPEGFVPATAPEVRAEIEAEVRAAWGASIPLGDDTFDGFLIGIVSERLGLLWEIGEISFSSMDRDAASGARLRSLGALTGTFELVELPSTVIETLTGDPGFVVPEGTIIATASTDVRFETATNTTLVALPSWAAIAYAVGDRVTNVSRCYQCITAGTSAAAGPTGTSADYTDGGGVHWKYLGEGTAATDVVMTSLETGAIEALADDLTSIETPVGGLSSARNLADAEIGRDKQTDEEFRLLVEAELAQPGTGTPDAIRAAMLEVAGVINAHVFFNSTEVTDVNGLPPHSTEILVQGGTDQAIADAIWANVPIGITTIGSVTAFVIDSEGVSQTVKFSRPTSYNIYIVVILVKEATEYAGDAAVKTAIVTWGDEQKVGKDVVASAIAAQAFAVAGVLDVTEVRIYTDVIGTAVAWAPTTPYVATVGARSVVTNGGRTYICITSGTSAGSGGPTGTGTDITDNTAHWCYLGATIPMNTRELALYDSTRITVTASSGTP